MNINTSPQQRIDAPEEAGCFPRRIVVPIVASLVMLMLAILFVQPERSHAQSTAQDTATTYTYTAYLPLAVSAAPWADISTRQASLGYYQSYYLTSDGGAIGWTGNLDSCTPGTTASTYRAAVAQRINYYRGMAGVPAIITLNDTYNQKAQAAALMMSSNNALSHTPPTSWQCYSSLGAAGAGSANLALGASGPAAINLYMRDNGNRDTVGHRRWVLYPQTQQMGTGDVPATSGHSATNALVIWDDHLWDARPTTRDPYVAWPPPGYVPYTVVYAYWTFSYANADFSSATVSMSSGGSNLSVAVYKPQNGFGENTLLWIPMGLNDSSNWPKPSADTTYHVNVNNVLISGTPHNFSYDVIIFDPGS
jgi:uncharacterized protein YkwD